MPRPRTHKSNPTLRATFWFVVVMLPSWWVLALALTGHGCSFETNPDKERDIWGQLHPSDDSDGGE
jgi:hypothetical protein